MVRVLRDGTGVREKRQLCTWSGAEKQAKVGHHKKKNNTGVKCIMNWVNVISVLLLPEIITVPSLCVADTPRPSTKQGSPRFFKANTNIGHIRFDFRMFPASLPSTMRLHTLSLSLSSAKNFLAPKCSLVLIFWVMTDLPASAVSTKLMTDFRTCRTRGEGRVGGLYIKICILYTCVCMFNFADHASRTPGHTFYRQFPANIPVVNLLQTLEKLPDYQQASA